MDTRRIATYLVLGSVWGCAALVGCSAPAGDSLGPTGFGSGGGNNGSDPGNGGSGGGGGTVGGGNGGGGNNGGGSGGGGNNGGNADGGSGSGSGDGGTSTGDGGGGGGGGQPKALFTALQADLTAACGGVCHVDGKGNAPAWLAGPDAYASIKAYRGIVVKDVPTSTLLSKGRHEGPDLIDPLRTKVTGWLTAEAAALTVGTMPTTDPFAVTAGANTVDIAKAGTNVTGAKMTFTAAISGTILTLTNITVVAPATGAVHVVYPIFVTIPATGSEMEDRSFSNADQTIAAGQSAVLQPGTLLLTGWSAGAKMRIEFTKLESGTVVAGGAGGCKSVATFTANAVPVIQANTCLNCHNTGGSGFGALDLSGLLSNPRDDARACAQSKNRINTTTPAQSDIIVAVTGGVAAHPFKNASAAYSQMMQVWIGNEK